MNLIPKSAMTAIREPIERANVIAIAALVIASVALIVAMAASHGR